jgi:tetratricopeptide (TPR) repeat protein
MRLNALVLVALNLVIASVCYAQPKLIKEADGFFYAKQYKEAYSLYKKAYDKKKDQAILVKMADCNYFIENYPVAQKYYSEYFTDTLYHATPDYTNYANASRLSGKIAQAAKIYGKINANGGDATTKQYVEIYQTFLDTSNKVRVYSLDSVYSCIDLDASESVDPNAAPMTYLWDFKDGTFAEGIIVTHCFKTTGLNKIALSIRDKATGYVKANDTAITVLIDEPVIKFTSPKKTRQYFYSTFEAQEPFIYNNDLLEYIWDFGNGEFALGKKVQKKFDKLEFLTVRLTVVAQNKSDGKKSLYSSCRAMEVVDNYSDHTQTFKDNLKSEK